MLEQHAVDQHLPVYNRTMTGGGQSARRRVGDVDMGGSKGVNGATAPPKGS